MCYYDGSEINVAAAAPPRSRFTPSLLLRAFAVRPDVAARFSHVRVRTQPSSPPPHPVSKCLRRCPDNVVVVVCANNLADVWARLLCTHNTHYSVHMSSLYVEMWTMTDYIRQTVMYKVYPRKIAQQEQPNITCTVKCAVGYNTLDDYRAETRQSICMGLVDSGAQTHMCVRHNTTQVEVKVHCQR